LRRTLGFALRLAGATALSLLVWWLAVTPFDRLPPPLSRSSFLFIAIRILNFPVAVAGELFYPIRGVQVLFDGYSTWCDFCPPDELFRHQMRIAIPTYLVLFYLPSLTRSIARRDARLFRRIVIGLLVYALFTTAFFLIIADSIGRSAFRAAALCLLILSAAAAFAWSKIGPRWKLTAIVAVLLAGASIFSFIASDSGGTRPFFVSYLMLLIFGVSATLGMTWAIERLAIYASNPRRERTLHSQ